MRSRPRRRFAVVLTPPQAAVQQTFGPVVLQAYKLVAGLGRNGLEAEYVAHPPVIGAPRLVEADQQLIRRSDRGRVDFGAADDARVAIVSRLQQPALAHLHGKTHNWIVRCLTMNFRQHGVGLLLGEEAAPLHRRQLRGIAKHKYRLVEGQQIAAEFLVHHRAFVDDDQACAGSIAVVIEHKGGFFTVDVFGPVNQRVDRACAFAAACGP